MALLDIQIVASSLQDIGGGLSAAQDEISWVQTAYLIAEIIVIPLSGWLTRVFSTRWLFTASAAGLHRHQHAVRPRLEHRKHDRVPRAARAARRLDDPDRVHLVLPLFPGAAPGLFRGGGRHDRLDRADARPRHRRLDHRHARIGTGCSTSISCRASRSRSWSPLLVKIDKPDLSLLKDADYPGIVLMAICSRHARICARRGSALELVRRCDDPRLAPGSPAIAGVLFVVRSLTFARPVVDLRAFDNRNFALGCFLSFVTGIGIFSTIYLTPLFLGYVRGFSAWQTGIAIFSTGAASLVGVPVYILLAQADSTRAG